jgi:hypothetical protein
MRTSFLTLLFVVALASPAAATDYEVDVTHDEGVGNCSDGECTLREAVVQAGPNDRVLLPSDQHYTLEQGELVLAGDTIVGEDARDTTIEQTTNNQRVFNVASGSNRISGVIITGGNTSSPGGGIAVAPSASLILSQSTVRENSSWTGGGIASSGTLTVVRSTLVDNIADQPTDGSEGGGIYSSGTTTLRNSTVSGNRASSGESTDSTGGGIYVRSGSFTAESTTIAENTALANPMPMQFRPSAIYRETAFGNASVTLNRTIVAETSSSFFAPCEGGPFPGSNNLFAHLSCGSPVDDPQLGPLQDNGGPTATHIPGTQAINSGGTSCPVDDQRGFVRPAEGDCDIGAVEVGSAADEGELRLFTEVINNSGGNKTAADFAIHVLRDGIDAAGSPTQGNAQGHDIHVPVGDYVVTGAASGYTTQVSGACAPSGAVTVPANVTRICTITFDDVAQQPGGGGGTQPPPPPGDDEQLPAPESGESVNVLPKSGTVKLKLRGSNRFVELKEGQQIPVGSTIDTTKGRVTLVAAGGQQADFYDGIFRISQGKGAKPLTTLTLVEAISCPKAGRAVVAAKKKKRRLWGDGSGKFRTKGKHSAATVVGTRWLVEDRCASTLTRVVRGRVSVRDFAKKKTVIVRAGKKYVARAKP